ncbi:helix-turn-helix domain-containing protein [Actinomadura latina]|uniref:Helix-turn-helix domain-containing protein n=1 Tax=Actinomadura latina TaxID=163603 RepID=A0A846YVZ8_9ACTN|nr:helix-turn-helix transcriptional regulator [Actinomadura latina]NKZ04619.1 helix-turn-helix domain-containing protein [Actinomadura latina]
MPERRPTIRERKLAAELRRLRERSTMRLDQVAAELQVQCGGRWSAPKLSRIETAAQGIKTSDVNQLCDLYGVPAEKREALLALTRTARQRGWWDAYADTIHTDYAAYIELEAEAKSLRCYNALMINGLLQTEEYAHEIIRVGLMQFAPLSEVDRRVEVRRTRQTLITRQEPEPLRVWSIIDEAALRRTIGGPEVMARQCDHLLSISEHPNVMIQVLPFPAGAHPATTGAFAHMEFPEHHMPDIVYIDGLTSALYVEDDAQVHTYSLAFNQLAMAALGADESLTMISDLAKLHRKRHIGIDEH